MGPEPAAKVVRAVKLPPAPPSRIETAPPKFATATSGAEAPLQSAAPSAATARSRSESPLKSPTATEREWPTTAKLVGAVKLTACADAGAAAASSIAMQTAPIGNEGTTHPDRPAAPPCLA